MEQLQVARFTALWTQTQTSVMAFIVSTVTNFSDADDVLQKVAGVAVSKFDQFSEDGDAADFARWSIQIAKFEVLRYLRDRATDRHVFLADSLGQVAEAFAEISPEFDVRRHALAHCISQLQGRSREVLEKRYGEGLNTRTIAGLMGLSAGNVSVILTRAYQKLRQCVESRIAAEAHTG